MIPLAESSRKTHSCHLQGRILSSKTHNYQKLYQSLADVRNYLNKALSARLRCNAARHVEFPQWNMRGGIKIAY